MTLSKAALLKVGDEVHLKNGGWLAVITEVIDEGKTLRFVVLKNRRERLEVTHLEINK